MRSVFHKTAPAPCPEPFNMAAYVLSQADRLADKTALAIIAPDGVRDWSYGALRRAVQGIAAGLRAQGLAPGDRLLMRLGNDVAFPLTYLGAIWAGIVPIPASAALTGPEITGIAAQTQPSAIVAAPGISLPASGPTTAAACPVISVDALHAMEGLPPLPPEMGDPERPAYIVFTSGTSGNPRGVIHAHRAVWARRMMWDGWYGLREDDRMLHAGAFNWTYTLGTGLMDPWAIGATALIPAEGVTPGDLPQLMKTHGVTLLAAAPGVYRQMLRAHPVIDAPKLRHGLSAGEKMADGIRADWAAATGRQVYEALGMSECSTFISGAPDAPAPTGSAGQPQPGRHIAVLDGDGQPVGRGMPGVLAVHRDDPGLMLGYLGAPEETAARFAGDWFLTGDIVALQEDDAVLYLGRDDDMMNAGGYRVSPLEVEAALSGFPGIGDVACCEVQVKTDTTVIGAFYTRAKAGDGGGAETGGEPALDPVALADFAAAQLARYKCPRIFTEVAALPRSGNGKINRKALRAHPTG